MSSSVIVLIIASHNPIFDSFLSLWREKIALCKLCVPNFRFFFVFADPLLPVNIVCENETNSITCKYEETLEPGIFLKTMDAIRFCEENFEYDYILRTNLSSFWNFPVLSSELSRNKPISVGNIFMQFLDRKQLYINARWPFFFQIIDSVFPSSSSNKEDFFVFLDGAGFLLSREMIRVLLIPYTDSSSLLLIPDDVAISILLYFNLTSIQNETEIHELLVDKKYICHSVESIEFMGENIGFVRNKQLNGNRNIDILNFRNQLDFFYRKN